MERFSNGERVDLIAALYRQVTDHGKDVDHTLRTKKRSLFCVELLLAEVCIVVNSILVCEVTCVAVSENVDVLLSMFGSVVLFVGVVSHRKVVVCELASTLFVTVATSEVGELLVEIYGSAVQWV